MNATDAERAVLGAVLSGFRQVDDLHLRAGDFYQPAHAAVWDAILRVRTSGIRPDAISVRSSLGNATELRGTNPEVFLAELIEACPLVMSAPVYAEEVGKAADRRGLDETFNRGHQMVGDGLDPVDIQDRVRKMLDCAPRRGGSTSRRWAEVEPEVIDFIERGSRKGIPTPWPDINRHIGGLVGSRVYTFGARPGEGKSLAGQAIAMYACRRRQSQVLFASLEMSELDFGVRLYADQASVPMDALLSTQTAPSHWEAINEASNAVRSIGLHLNADPVQSMADIRAEARGIEGLGLVVIDYLQLVQPADKKAPRREQVDQISRDTKLLAKELDVPVVSLAQLNRGPATRTDKTPVLSDFRESGSIEMDSDVAILFDLDEETSELTAHVAKNRHGSKGQVSLELWGHLARIVQSDGRAA